MTSNDEWLQKVPIQNDDMAWRVVDDECIIVDPQGSTATVLNAVGARIWELCDGKRTVDDIITQLIDEFSVERDQAVADVTSFVDDLTKRDLLTI